MAAFRFAIRMKVNSWKINAVFVAVLNDLPCAAQFHRNADFFCKDVHSAQWHDCQSRAFESVGNIANPIKYFVDCAVASCGDDCIEAFNHGFNRGCDGSAWPGRHLQNAVGGETLQMLPEFRGLLAAGGWIEYHANWHAVDMVGEGLGVQNKWQTGGYKSVAGSLHRALVSEDSIRDGSSHSSTIDSVENFLAFRRVRHKSAFDKYGRHRGFA
jgi:hypothetical protein